MTLDIFTNIEAPSDTKTKQCLEEALAYLLPKIVRTIEIQAKIDGDTYFENMSRYLGDVGIETDKAEVRINEFLEDVS